MPVVPLNPTLTSTSDERISVISVMPETGFVPTMAMALAATVVKRNAMMKTIRMAVTDCTQPSSSPKWKKTKTEMSVAIRMVRMRFIEMSRCVRSEAATALFAASELRDREAHGLADDLRLADDADDARHGDAADADGLADEGEEVLGGEDRLRVGDDVGACDAQQREHRGGSTASASEPTTGTITNHTRHEPAVMIMAYFRPMM